MTIGGVVGFSGFLLPTIKLAELDESKKQMPMLLYHGQQDPMIPAEFASLGYKKLIDTGFNVKYQVEQGLEQS